MSKLDHSKGRMARLVQERGRDGRTGKVAEESSRVHTEEDDRFEALKRSVARFNRGLPRGAEVELRRQSLRSFELVLWWMGKTRRVSRQLQKANPLQDLLRLVWPESAAADRAYGDALVHYVQDTTGRTAKAENRQVQCPLCAVRVRFDRLHSHWAERCSERDKVPAIGVSKLMRLAIAEQSLPSTPSRPRVQRASVPQPSFTKVVGIQQPKELLACPLCGQKVLRKNLLRHMKTRCRERANVGERTLEDLFASAKPFGETGMAGAGRREPKLAPKKVAANPSVVRLKAKRVKRWRCPHCGTKVRLHTGSCRIDHILFHCPALGPGTDATKPEG